MFSLGLLISPTHITAAVYDRLAGEWRYYAHQPRELTQALLAEISYYFGAVQVFEHRSP